VAEREWRRRATPEALLAAVRFYAQQRRCPSLVRDQQYILVSRPLISTPLVRLQCC
jgi:hypothetical protein